MNRRLGFLALLLFGCTSSNAPMTGAPDLAVANDLGKSSFDLPIPVAGRHTILPSLTDPKINDPDDAHIAVSPGGLGNGRLLVFMSGSGGTPAGYDLFFDYAAANGYHVLGLGYPDKSGSVASQCTNDLACYGKLREETWSGQDTSPIIAVSVDNSIHNRLIKLLQYVVTEFPDEGWDTYYAAGDAVWSRVVVGGHSQGGGHAAYIARLHNVMRVIMFSSPGDAAGNTTPPTPATWIGGAHVTPIDHYFGVDHVDDAAYHDKVFADFKALGLPGDVQDVDKVAPPYHNSHQLTASQPLTAPHNQIITDGTPLVGGASVFQPMWKYMLGY